MSPSSPRPPASSPPPQHAASPAYPVPLGVHLVCEHGWLRFASDRDRAVATLCSIDEILPLLERIATALDAAATEQAS